MLNASILDANLAGTCRRRFQGRARNRSSWRGMFRRARRSSSRSKPRSPRRGWTMFPCRSSQRPPPRPPRAPAESGRADHGGQLLFRPISPQRPAQREDARARTGASGNWSRPPSRAFPAITSRTCRSGATRTSRTRRSWRRRSPPPPTTASMRSSSTGITTTTGRSSTGRLTRVPQGDEQQPHQVRLHVGQPRLDRTASLQERRAAHGVVSRQGDARRVSKESATTSSRTTSSIRPIGRLTASPTSRSTT